MSLAKKHENAETGKTLLNQAQIEVEVTYKLE